MEARKLTVKFFSTLVQAEELARATDVEQLEVRCTQDDRHMVHRMMAIVAAVPRDRLKIELPVFETELGPIVAAAKVRRLELVDRSQQLKTAYVFERDGASPRWRLAVTAEVPGGKKRVMGVDSAPEVFTVILDALERSLASIPAGTLASLSLWTRPTLVAPEHVARLATIARRFDGVVT
jgi:hypothetical protein